MAYQCPLCQQPLSLTERTYACENRHQFDVAKEGYVNLMPAHHKRSKDPGDNKEMMQARRRFLEAGHYDPMRDQIAVLCAQALQGSQHQLLDIGCGEGYYTTYVANALQAQNPQAQTYGLDISKIAVRYAAKRYTNCEFTVASSHRLPFADASLDGILRIYAPCKAEELQRCVRNNGAVITVTPAARHLYQFKQGIYQDVRLHEEQPEIIDGFELETQQKLNYMMTLSGEEAFDLLQMTPFAWRASEEFKSEVRASEQFECEADFMLRVYRKQSPSE
ncbi:23S rRNA (guanine(745)-N(1))-methyltransferase [Vibrio fluvialis]|jgi:23S rRNA (guanine745-N1)-methyltransferase|uniref:23S rRNA (Guanine(745)-N(1))-methyltransferase n=3 Tax=Vibrio TaxID=662 RepID=A0AAX2LSR7_VIBFL|nr:23S rRNA (guanine(745)-N(1))-methyltransferase [Vibrio fluvialis]TNF15369.1 MAG: 23S rRNA (guanine(745)-N(1))-methyltransferase [Vibrionaceae bacterium]AMF94910.1 23S rRNA (guanine(745)-N(1))-methyltransferase [Vibrio fluvialis]EKO3368806.1 23S rRNA (guanine(745)-N(1))-methyltransferase [Vibrio fluvialis]EKO3371283.1 23S rRNA (guanine(745)-N(1))-methyltransferase [Vibrio fluvialis]EKO3380262.1 23S rRNA (guanine(745)-N(1))-methyltransferase [Vibrio fluvialis]